MAKSTMKELVDELTKLQPRTPRIQQLINLACSGEFHDYKNKMFVCGKVAACQLFMEVASAPDTGMEAAARLIELKREVEDGEYDEEADAEDQAMLAEDLKSMGLGKGFRQ